MTEQNRSGIITFSITDRGALYSSYMSFTRNGGLFIPTARNYEMGDEIFMLLKVMDDSNYSAVTGTVAWVTPAGAQGNKVPGIGVHFSESDNGATRSNIEHHLGATLSGDRARHTM